MKAIILTTFLSFLNVGLASAKTVPSVCSTDFADSPHVTPQKNGSVYICSAVPAAHITKNQARQQALGMNHQQARQLCPSGFNDVKPPQVLDYPFEVAVVSLVFCK